LKVSNKNVVLIYSVYPRYHLEAVSQRI
jgi:hypothetical protein